jgi:hypothetical protein
MEAGEYRLQEGIAKTLFIRVVEDDGDFHSIFLQSSGVADGRTITIVKKFAAIAWVCPSCS